jgi:hypothetical protein
MTEMEVDLKLEKFCEMRWSSQGCFILTNCCPWIWNIRPETLIPDLEGRYNI